MMVNTPKLQQFYQKLMAEKNLSLEESLRICDALYEEALALGAINLENIWGGFEVDLRIAQAMRDLQHLRDSREPCKERSAVKDA